MTFYHFSLQTCSGHHSETCLIIADLSAKDCEVRDSHRSFDGTRMSGSFELLTVAWEEESEKLTGVEERNRAAGYSSLMLLRCAGHSCASGDICVQVSIFVILEKLPFLFPIHDVGQVTNLSQWAVMRLKIHSTGVIQPSFRAHSKIALLSLLACLLFPDQKQLGEENVYLDYTSRSQFIKEENQGRNSS